MQSLTRSLKLINAELRENREANRLFLEILASPRNPELILRRMNESGVLGKFIPDFGKIVAMMQFNMYHHYTVDEHLLRCIAVLSEMERGELENEHPLSNHLITTLKRDRNLLYVALLLHDIAKGRPEDHSVAGARIARRLGPRFGLTPSETETVEWLVREHLTMSMVAQSRDLNDRKTIIDFADTVQTMERLKLLLILTVCDIKAVGPGVWNGWKGQLLRTLFYETELVLTGGFSELSRADRDRQARQALAENWPTGPGRTRRLSWPALSELSLHGQSGRSGATRAFHPRGRPRRPRARHHGEAAYIRGGDGNHRPGAGPSPASVDHHRRLCGGGRQYRGRADFHHRRRARARHDPHQPRIRPR